MGPDMPATGGQQEKREQAKGKQAFHR